MEEVMSEDPAGELLMECEDDDLAPSQCSMGQDGGEQKAARDGEERDNEWENGSQSEDVTAVPIPLGGTSGRPLLLKSYQADRTILSPSSPGSAPLGFILNGQPISLLRGGGAAQLQLLSQTGGSASGFTAVQLPVTLTLQSSGSGLSTATRHSSTSLQPASPPPRPAPTPALTPIITGVASGRAAEEVAADGRVSFIPPAPVGPSSSCSRGLSMKAGASTSTTPQAVPPTPRPAGLIGPVEPPDCKLCGAQYRMIKALRGYMCACCVLIAQSLSVINGSTKPKRGTRDSSSKKPSSSSKTSRPPYSKTTVSPPSSSKSSYSRSHSSHLHRLSSSVNPSASKSLSRVSMGKERTSPRQQHQQHQQECSVGIWPELLPDQPVSRGKLIILVEDFYYGSDLGGPCMGAQGGQGGQERPPVFKCLQCDKNLRNNIRFMNHMKHHVELVSQEDGHLDRHTSCQFCYRHFDTSFRLQCHLECVHSQYESTSTCRICELAFEDEPAFLLHMKNSHKPGEMPYACQVCNFRSSFYSEVMSHFREAHSGSHNLLCPYCLRVVRSSSSYQQHYLRHQKKSVFACDKCRLQFLFSKDRAEHKVQHHKTHIKPKQLEGLRPGTKVTIRTYSVTGGGSRPSKQGFNLSSLPSKIIRVDPGPPPEDSPKKKPVETLAVIMSNFQKRRMGEVKEQSCVECLHEVPDFSQHYPTVVHCSLCRYITCCSRAYANHMINNHVTTKATTKYRAMFQSNPRMPVRLKCVSCWFITTVGDMMANHLVDHPDHSHSVLYTGPDPKDIQIAERAASEKMEWQSLLKHRATDTVTSEVGDVTLGLTEGHGGSFVPLHLLSSRTTSSSAQVSVRPLLAPSPRSSSPAMTIKFLGPKAKDTDLRGPALSVSQLTTVLYALCNGLPQATLRYGTKRSLILSWIRQQDKLRSNRDWGWSTDRVAEWVLAQREQQLPINKKNLLQTATEALDHTQGMGEFYEWAVDFMLRHNLSLQPSLSSAHCALPRNVYESTRLFTRFIAKQVRELHFKTPFMGTLDELSLFVDPKELAARNPTAFQLFGTSKTPMFEVVLSGLADGTFLPPMVFFRGAHPVIPSSFPKLVFLVSRPEGFNDEQRLQLWLDKVWRPHLSPRGRSVKGLLVMDTHRGHLDDGFLAGLSSAATVPAVIPIGCSCRLQPLEACVLPALRQLLQAHWSRLVARGGAEGPVAPGTLALQLVDWLSQLGGALAQRPHLLQRSFTAVCTPPNEEGEEGPGHMVRELTEALIGSEEEEEEEGGGSAVSQPPESPRGLLALRQVFEKDSDLESFHGFEDKEISEFLNPLHSPGH